MVETLDTWIAAMGPMGYLVLFGAALIEYVFPPFPGDTVVLLGGVYAVRGDRPWILVLLVVTLGSVIGAAIDYFVGRGLKRKFETGPEFALHHPHIVRIQDRMREKGMLLIAFNRFFPGVRSLFFVAAGAAEMDLRRVLVWAAFSSALWNSLIMAVGSAVGGNAERLEALVGQYTRAAWVGLAAVGLVVALRYLWKLRRRPQEQ